MRIAKNENILERPSLPRERIFFFCMRQKPGGAKRDRNQKVAIDICIKDKCEYLELGAEPRCHCRMSMQYVEAFKGNWRKRREEQPEQEPEKEMEAQE